MSGYRTIHREQILSDESGPAKEAIWSVHATPIQTTASSGPAPRECWRMWSASSDGFVRVYTVREKNATDDTLDASALSFRCTHVLVGANHRPPPADVVGADIAVTRGETLLGCTCVTSVRNYVGEDENDGERVVVSLDLGGTVRIWKFVKEWEEKRYDGEGDEVKSLKSLHEFTVANATGTTTTLAPPRVMQSKEVVAMAVGCLDGTVAVVSTGISTPVAKKDPAPAGTVLLTFGSPGSSIPMSLSWNPIHTETLVIGRQDGSIDTIRPASKKNHRLAQLSGAPVRATSYTPDANLLIAGNDTGLICIWDVNRPSPVLVHHISQAHVSWVVDIQCLSDSRRFVSVGTDRKLHIWSIGQISNALHTIHLDSTTWALHHESGEPRMIAGSESGWVFVFSLDT